MLAPFFISEQDWTAWYTVRTGRTVTQPQRCRPVLHPCSTTTVRIRDSYQQNFPWQLWICQVWFCVLSSNLITDRRTQQIQVRTFRINIGRTRFRTSLQFTIRRRVAPCLAIYTIATVYSPASISFALYNKGVHAICSLQAVAAPSLQ